MNQLEYTNYLLALDVRARNGMNAPVRAYRLRDGAMIEITHPDQPPTHGFIVERRQALRLGLQLLRIWWLWKEETT